MNITMTARHCELDPEIRLFAEQRLGKLGRFARDIREAHLILTAEKYRHSAEITLKLNQHEIVSREQSNDVRGAIDRAADRLEQQLRRLKDKRVEHKRMTLEGNGEPAIEPAIEDGDAPGPAFPGED